MSPAWMGGAAAAMGCGKGEPVWAMDAMCQERLSPPTLDRVAVRSTGAWPGASARLKEPGARVATGGKVPCPDRETDKTGLSWAFAVAVKVPDCGPVAVGAKPTWTVRV